MGPGLKSVRITNPDGQFTEFQDILLYTSALSLDMYDPEALAASYSPEMFYDRSERTTLAPTTPTFAASTPLSTSPTTKTPTTTSTGRRWG